MGMGLKDVDGSFMMLYGHDGRELGSGEHFEWKLGKVGPIFDDSFDHSVSTPVHAAQSRFILAVGLLHPDLVRDPGHYAEAFNQRTAAGHAWPKSVHEVFTKL